MTYRTEAKIMGDHDHMARCDDGCGDLGETREDAIRHVRETGHHAYYRWTREEVYGPRLQDQGEKE